MAGTIRYDMESTYGDFAPNDVIQSQWADDVNASLDDKASKSRWNYHTYTLDVFRWFQKDGTGGSFTAASTTPASNLVNDISIGQGAVAYTDEIVGIPTNCNRVILGARFKVGSDTIGPVVEPFEYNLASSNFDYDTATSLGSETLASITGGGGHAWRQTTADTCTSNYYLGWGITTSTANAGAFLRWKDAVVLMYEA